MEVAPGFGKVLHHRPEFRIAETRGETARSNIGAGNRGRRLEKTENAAITTTAAPATRNASRLFVHCDPNLSFTPSSMPPIRNVQSGGICRWSFVIFHLSFEEAKGCSLSSNDK